MMRIRRLIKNSDASAILDSLIAVGISVSLLTVFFTSADTLYEVEDEPGADLQLQSASLMEGLINAPGQDLELNPEWHQNGHGLDVLGFGTTKTVQYGIIKQASIHEASKNKYIFEDGPYPNSTIGESTACFLAGTKIVMSDESLKNIEEIKIGEMVKSYDEKNHKIDNKKVTFVFHHEPEEMGEYYLIINDLLQVTPNHQFYLDGNWVQADELEIGDNLFYPSDGYKINTIVKIFEKTYTYNFEVEGNHNYFIAMNAENALVHNGFEEPGEGEPGEGEPGEGGEEPGGGGGVQGQVIINGITITNVPPFPLSGYPPLTVKLQANVPQTQGEYNIVTPINYSWDFDYDTGEGFTVDYEEIEYTYYSDQQIHTYTQSGTYTVKVKVEDADKGVGSAIFSNIQVDSIPGNYFTPIAHYTWFDKDGPYSDPLGPPSEERICFDPTTSQYYGNTVTFNWYVGGAGFPFATTDQDNPTTCRDCPGGSSITLKVVDDLGGIGTYSELVTPNVPEPLEFEYLPWVLTGKNINPEPSSFTPVNSDYYLKITKLEESVSLYEIKEKVNSDKPLLDYDKIENFTDIGYISMYEEIKSLLGLDNDETLYNFRIEITIYNNDGSVDEKITYGASADTAIAKESTTRQVLVYYNPTVKNDLGTWSINKHPNYKQADFTLYILLGGTPPSVP